FVAKTFVKLLRKSIDYETPLIYVYGDEDEENLRYIKDKKIAIIKSPENIKNEIERVKNLIEETKIRMESYKKERASLIEEYEKTKDEERRKYLRGRIKALSRLIDECNLAIKTKSEDVARHYTQIREHEARKYINLYEWLAKEEWFINKLITEEYNSIMRETFFAGPPPILLKNSLNYIDIENLKFAIGHNIASVKSSIPQKLAMKKASFLYGREISYNLAPECDVVLFSHAPSTKFSFEPKKFNSNECMLFLQTGIFGDPEIIKECKNRKIRVPLADLVEKGLDSSLTILHYDKGLLSIEIINSEELKKIGYEVMKKELENLNYKEVADLLTKKRIDRGEHVAENVWLKMQIIESTFPLIKNPGDLARYVRYRLIRDIIKHEMESIDAKEADKRVDEYLSKLSKEEKLELVKKYLDLSIQTTKRRLEELKIDLISDIHLGMANPKDEITNYELLKNYIEESRKDPPNIIINGGDNVSGGSVGAMKEEASQKHVLEEIINEVKEGKIEKIEYKVPYLCVDTQFNLLTDLERYMVEVVKKGGYLVLISGNHYNKSHFQGRFDEATRIFGDLIKMGLTLEEVKRIKVFSGLDYGIGSTEIEGIPIFGIHKAKMRTDKTTGLAEYKPIQRRNEYLCVSAHYHSPGGQKENGCLALALPSFAPMTEYPEKLSIPPGIRGFYRVTLFVEGIMKGDKEIKQPADHVVITFYPASYLVKKKKEEKEKI
ncbi:MAG: metallophosphoesterase, partial [Candidatus Micrarchaeia archaeon]